MSIEYVALTEEDQRSLKRAQLEQDVITARNELRAVETNHFQLAERSADDPGSQVRLSELENQHAVALEQVKAAESELANHGKST